MAAKLASQPPATVAMTAKVATQAVWPANLVHLVQKTQDAVEN